MHPEAHEFVRAAMGKFAVADLGGRDVNGTCRDLFPGWVYVSVDERPGRGVDVVADATTWDADGKKFDAVISTETLEHCRDWWGVVANAHELLKPGGLFVVTAAGPGREPHGCDGGPKPPGEWYCNVDPLELRDALEVTGFAEVAVDVSGADVRATARRRR
jgi:SAM-dependent methyltransferase